jgi:alpha-aminoadipate carrier protein LysW
VLALEEARCREARANKGGITTPRLFRRCSSFPSSAFLYVQHSLQEERKPMMANCPECGGDVPVANVERGEILPCPDCGAELEVRSIEPLLLELAPEVKEDWGE